MLRDILVFSAGAVMTALGVRLSASSPFWDWVIGGGVLVMLLSAGHLASERIVRPRLKGKNLDPLLVTAMLAALISFGALAIYAFRTPFRAAGVSDQISSQPNISILSPKDRYEFAWDPATSMQIQLGREGKPKIKGTTYMPAFVLRNSSSVAAQDATVKWRTDISQTACRHIYSIYLARKLQ